MPGARQNRAALNSMHLPQQLLQEASKARESRLRKAGLQGRARMASELREMDNDIAALSKALAVSCRRCWPTSPPARCCWRDQRPPTARPSAAVHCCWSWGRLAQLRAVLRLAWRALRCCCEPGRASAACLQCAHPPRCRAPILQVRTLQLEMEYAYGALEDETRDIVGDSKGGDLKLALSRRGSSDEVALLVAGEPGWRQGDARPAWEGCRGVDGGGGLRSPWP